MGLADTIEQELGSRRSDSGGSEWAVRSAAMQKLSPEAADIRRREVLPNSGGLLPVEQVTGRPSHPFGNAMAENAPISTANVSHGTSASGGLAATVEAALGGSSTEAARVTTAPKEPAKLSDSPRSVLDRTAAPGDFAKNQVQPSDIADALMRSVRGVGASILGGYEGLRQIANNRGREEAARATTETVERGTGSPQTPGGMKLQEVMQSGLNPLTWPSRIGAAVGNSTLSSTGSPAAATTVDTAINALPAIMLRGQGSARATLPKIAANETVRESAALPQSASVPLSAVGAPIDVTARNPVGARTPVTIAQGAPTPAPAAAAAQSPITVRGNATAASNPVEAAAQAKGVTWEQQAAIDTIRRFAKDPDAILSAENKQLVPGSAPTLAEITKDPGLAQLQRSQQSKNTNLANDIADNRAARTSARSSLMEQFAGSPEELAYFTDARRQITKPLYEAAENKVIDISKQPLEIKREVGDLLKKPAIQEAMKEAEVLMKNKGVPLNSDKPIQHMHFMKLALDDKISTAVKAGNNVEVGILHGVQDNLVGLMQKLAPEYGKAMAEFEAASKPINRLQVGQYLKEKLLPAVNGYGGDRTTINNFVKSLEHPDQAARLATNFTGAKMANVLSKDEISTLKSLAQDVVRQQNVESAARITGSPTAQLTAAQGKLANAIEGAIEKIKYLPFRGLGTSFVAAGAEKLNTMVKAARTQRYETELNKMLMNPDYAKDIYAKSQVKP